MNEEARQEWMKNNPLPTRFQQVEKGEKQKEISKENRKNESR